MHTGAPSINWDALMDFGDDGLYLYADNRMELIDGGSPDQMCQFGDSVALSYNQLNTLSLFDGTEWAVITIAPEKMTARNNTLVLNYVDLGLITFDGTGWEFLRDPIDQMAAWGDTLVVSTDAEGLLIYDGSAWTTLHEKPASRLFTWGNKLVAYWDDWELWSYDGTEWAPIYSRSLGDIKIGAWNDKLIVNFISLG